MEQILRDILMMSLVALSMYRSLLWLEISLALSMNTLFLKNLANRFPYFTGCIADISLALALCKVVRRRISKRLLMVKGWR